jgi:hypothetical protein
MRMTSITAIFTLIFTVFTSQAWAKLPPPTPEEEAKVAATKQKAGEDAAKEKEKLEKVQDRIAQKFGSQKSGGTTSRGASTDERTEVPSAALNSRPVEKAGAYNEAVTPQSAAGASQGTRSPAAAVPQNQTPK